MNKLDCAIIDLISAVYDRAKVPYTLDDAADQVVLDAVKHIGNVVNEEIKRVKELNHIPVKRHIENIVKSFKGIEEYRVYVNGHTEEELDEVFGDSHWFVMEDGRQTNDYDELGSFINYDCGETINIKFMKERVISVYGVSTKYYRVEIEWEWFYYNRGGKIRHSRKELEEYGRLYTIEEFLEGVKSHLLMDEDGFGHPVYGNGTVDRNINVYPSDMPGQAVFGRVPEHAKWILWFNR